MRLIVIGVLIVACCTGISAQAPQPAPPVSVDAIRAALQRSPQTPLVFRDAVPPPDFRRRQLGILTLVPPATNTQVVNVSIPVGELTMRAARAFSNARHRRAAQAAERRVREDLRAFQARQQRP